MQGSQFFQRPRLDVPPGLQAARMRRPKMAQHVLARRVPDPFHRPVIPTQTVVAGRRHLNRFRSRFNRSLVIARQQPPKGPGIQRRRAAPFEGPHDLTLLETNNSDSLGFGHPRQHRHQVFWRRLAPINDSHRAPALRPDRPAPLSQLLEGSTVRLQGPQIIPRPFRRRDNYQNTPPGNRHGNCGPTAAASAGRTSIGPTRSAPHVPPPSAKISGSAATRNGDL